MWTLLEHFSTIYEISASLLILFCQIMDINPWHGQWFGILGDESSDRFCWRGGIIGSGLQLLPVTSLSLSLWDAELWWVWEYFECLGEFSLICSPPKFIYCLVVGKWEKMKFFPPSFSSFINLFIYIYILYK